MRTYLRERLVPVECVGSLVTYPEASFSHQHKRYCVAPDCDPACLGPASLLSGYPGRALLSPRHRGLLADANKSVGGKRDGTPGKSGNVCFYVVSPQGAVVEQVCAERVDMQWL